MRKNMLEHRSYLLRYDAENWLLGWWQNLLKSPPCLPDSKRSKDFEYELIIDNSGLKPALILNLVGFSSDLDGVEKNLVKFGIARIDTKNNQLIQLISDEISIYSTSKRYDLLKYSYENDLKFVYGKIELLHAKYSDLEDYE